MVMKGVDKMAAYTEIRQIVKDISAWAKKNKDAEILDRVIDLQTNISDLHEENEDLKNKVRDLMDELANLSEQKNKQDHLSRFHDLYVDNDELLEIKESEVPYSDSLLEHMYCPRCLQENNKLISVNVERRHLNETYGLECPVCKFVTWFGRDPTRGFVKFM